MQGNELKLEEQNVQATENRKETEIEKDLQTLIEKKQDIIKYMKKEKNITLKIKIEMLNGCETRLVEGQRAGLGKSLTHYAFARWQNFHNHNNI